MELIVRVNGGLGNQFFQYAMGRTLADRLHTELLLDLSFYALPPGEHTSRSFQLDRFHTRYRVATEDQLEPYYDLSNNKWLRRTAKLFPFLFARQNIFEQHHFQFDGRTRLIKKNTYFSGYWQNVQYFSGSAGTIRHDLSIRDRTSDQISDALRASKEQVPVSLHVRRGDYVSNPAARAMHGTCDLEYYARAMRQMLMQVPQAVFHVFSDDLAWCRANLPTMAPLVLMENNNERTDHHDLALMSACHHHIIANSSFSWWAAWLNPSPGKIVIAPKRWLLDPAVDTKGLIPSNWILL